MRKQYHLRPSDRGLLAWDVHGLIDLVKDRPVLEIGLEQIRELDENYWSGQLSCRQVAEHAQLISETDLSHPIILDPDGRMMDGMHRVCKALNEGRGTILARQLESMPEPDFVGVAEEDLPVLIVP